MEVKKSHKADLEHWRPLMFVAGVLLPLLVFVGAMGLHISLPNLFSDDDDDLELNMQLEPNDDRDLISAAEKVETVAAGNDEEKEKEAQDINVVDEVQKMIDSNQDLFAFKPGEDPDNEELKEEEEQPINLNDDSIETQIIVEELPEYPGGMVEFMKWLTATLKYPPSALRTKIEGTVLLCFIVNTDGSISDIKIKEHAHILLEKEALRVAKLMPNWKPGRDKGKVCRSQVAIPIVFEI